MSVVFRDELHGDIRLSSLLLSVVDHPLFQRLRGIRQMGLAEFVFPTANHTRFQHSLGIAHLALHYWDAQAENLDRFFEVPFGASAPLLEVRQTVRAWKSVLGSTTSTDYWRELFSLAALLHDIGHGPFSHTFELLPMVMDLEKELKNLSPELQTEMGLRMRRGRWGHEHMTLLYANRILREVDPSCGLQKKYMIGLAYLLLPEKRSMPRQLLGPFLRSLQKQRVGGGALIPNLLKPALSGPFDLDKIDYIQRDGRNCGVALGYIEWQRLFSRLFPCAAHPNFLKTSKGAARHSPIVLLSKISNFPVLDDFTFRCFQMYSQVYLHPKIVGFDEMLRRVLVRALRGKPLEYSLEEHAEWTDSGFRHYVRHSLGSSDIEALLMRQIPFEIQIAFSGGRQRLSGYHALAHRGRMMLKDPLTVLLYGRLPMAEPARIKESSHQYQFLPWQQVSPMARFFLHTSYHPHFLIRTPYPVLG